MYGFSYTYFDGYLSATSYILIQEKVETFLMLILLVFPNKRKKWT
jgi:hypothetical protein